MVPLRLALLTTFDDDVVVVVDWFAVERLLIAELQLPLLLLPVAVVVVVDMMQL